MNDKTKEILESLFVDHIDGNLDKASIEELEHQISSSDSARDYWLLLHEIWLASFTEEKNNKYDADKAFEKLMAKVRQESKKPVQKRQWKADLWKIASVAASLAIVAIFAFFGGKKHVESTFADIVIEAPEGSRTFTTLPDSTTIILTAGSKVIYSQGFGVKDRSIKFRGEGYFDVSKNEKIPFIVNSDNINVKVLGTEFSIRDLPDDREVLVSLYDGHLLLENKLKDNDFHKMVSEDLMIMDKDTGIMRIKSKSGNKTNQEYAEKGYMVFDEMPLSDILNTLHLNYDVNFTVKDKTLLTDRYRGIFVKSEQPVEDILKVLSNASHGRFRYTIKEKEITLL